MKREQIQEKFKATAELARRETIGKRRAAEATLRGMTVAYPWLRDYAALLSLSLAPSLTREFPWLAPPAKASAKNAAAKTRHTNAAGRVSRGVAASKHGTKTDESCATEQASPWVKPPTAAGFEYRQCYKPNCRCMRGGAWHGPYGYHKKRDGKAVHSKYLGRQPESASELVK